MQSKYLKFSLLLFLIIVCFNLNAQTMYVRPIIGTQSSYPVSNIQKLTFSNGNLLLTNLTGANGIFPLSENRYINFTNLNLGSNIQELVKNSFYVYPNPTATILNIVNDDVTQIISHLEIISLEGRVLLKQITSQVDVASLPRGTYFCRINSNEKTQTIKFLKQ